MCWTSRPPPPASRPESFFLAGGDKNESMKIGIGVSQPTDERHRYTGSLDPDHAVGVAGDSGGRIAFAWELGYMKALRAAVLAEG